MLKRLFLLLAIIALVSPAPAGAQRGKLAFIRDSEVENTIRTFATPLLEAAGLDPAALRIFLVQDKTLNAFVAGGQNIFFHTGLLIRAEHPGQLIGVIAHEIGHISGGHLARGQGAVEGATAEALAAMILGAAVGVATGRGDAGSAIMMGGQQVATRNLLAFSRSQEQSADQTAVRLLDATGQSSTGIVEFFDILGDQELLIADRQDPYVRTHPLTRDRVNFVRNHVELSPHTNAGTRPEWVEMHRRMRAKLFAFFESPARTLQRYKESDRSIEARYARAIAFYRKPDLGTAIPLIDELIAERPADPYFHELKGQMLFENGRGEEAIAPYRQSVALLPDDILLRLGLGQVLVETEDPARLAEAKTHLQLATAREPTSRSAWRLLSIAYGRSGEEGMAAYAMAEQELLENRLAEAGFHAGKAEQMLPKTGSVWLRIQDIKNQAAQVKANRK